ncbi:MAG: tetratricopeptide repeat protein [Gemmataceae bacterium]
MAVETATTNAAPPKRPIWHVPLFMLGMACLAAAWFGRPIWPESPARLTKRDLALARAAVDKADGNLEYALKLAMRAVQASQKIPDFAGEAAFLTGSIHLKLAEKTGLQSEHWGHARAYLDQALRIGVSEVDRPKLEYRLARAGLQTGMELHHVAAYLESAAAHADSKVEAFTLLTDVYLRMTPPKWKEALAANLKLRNAEELTETQANLAKLQGGEILLKMGQPREARKSLEKIDDRAPVEILQQARLLRARSHQEEKNWAEAALQYQAALADTRHLPAEANLARYQLGVCFRGLERREEAIRTWQACLSNPKTAEYTAAAIALADAYLDEPALEPALDALNRSVEHLKSGVRWKNPHVDLPTVLRTFERARSAFQQAERFDLLYKLVTPQERLISPEMALLARAEAALLWGQALKKSPGLEEIERSNSLLREAGARFDQAAQVPELAPEIQAERYFQSALAYFAADDREKGASALFRMRTLPANPDLLSEANYRLGEYYREKGEKKKAIEMYHDCMKYNRRFVAHARYRVAMYDLEDQRLEDAEAGLVANVNNLAWESDAEIKAESLYALANLLYVRRDYSRVMFYLESWLTRFNDDPAYRSTPNYTRLRFMLADVYRRVASAELTESTKSSLTPESKRHHEERYRLYLQKSATELEGLYKFVRTEKGKNHLSPAQRAEIPWMLSSCLYEAGKYAEAIQIYDQIAEENENKIEAVIALGQAVRCHNFLFQEDKIRQRLLQIEKAIPHLSTEHREKWKAWVIEARKKLEPIR